MVHWRCYWATYPRILDAWNKITEKFLTDVPSQCDGNEFDWKPQFLGF